ncbi:MAG: arylesterase [Gemmatimonadetes bacterium]|nr:arylesterase [Gemmatimonadota bacterium]
MGRKIAGSAFVALVVACGSAQEAPERPPLDRRADTAAGTDVPAIVFLGTSLTAGLGVGEDAAFPALIQDTVDALGLGLRVVNAGINGETSAGGRRRIDWLLRQPVAVLVIELGANDGLRGLDVRAMRANLQGIIDRTRSVRPEARIVLVGMRAPPNLGMIYTEAFERVFRELAADNELALVPFLLDGVGGNPKLNQPDGIHPTVEGHRIVARNVWRALADVAREVVADATSGGS